MLDSTLKDHWLMCQFLRRHEDPDMRQVAQRYFEAKLTTISVGKIEAKALHYIRGPVVAPNSKQTL